MHYLIAVFGTFILVTAAIPLVKTLALRIGLVDLPNARKVHQKPMPFVGGIAMAFGVLVVAWILPVPPDFRAGITGGGLVILAVGLADDFLKSRGRDLSAAPKFAGQVLAALLLLSAGIRVEFLSNPFSGGMIHLANWQSLAVTVLWVVGVANIINFMDGLDGLACGIVTIAALTMAGVSLFMGDYGMFLMSLALAAVTTAFLRFNFNPASMFMGDGGAYFLGFVLAAVSIEGAFKSATVVGLAVPVLILGLPIADTVYNVIRRVRNGQPFYIADRGHAHHRLLNAGFDQRQVVLVLYLISACFSLTALLVMFAGRF
ncbi:MAG TPA: MraY family glycosyltransferase [Bacillota bacterium]|nr:MraY family glycosyltransferase [Bacillota bacterium]